MINTHFLSLQHHSCRLLLLSFLIWTNFQNNLLLIAKNLPNSMAEGWPHQLKEFAIDAFLDVKTA